MAIESPPPKKNEVIVENLQPHTRVWIKPHCIVMATVFKFPIESCAVIVTAPTAAPAGTVAVKDGVALVTVMIEVPVTGPRYAAAGLDEVTVYGPTPPEIVNGTVSSGAADNTETALGTISN
jgi:hypothetical protein